MNKSILFKLLLCSSIILLNQGFTSNTSETLVPGGYFYIKDGSQATQYKMDISDNGECYVGENDLAKGVGICVFQEPGGSRSNIGAGTLTIYRDGQLLNNNKLTIRSGGTILTSGLFVNQNNDFQVLGNLYCGAFPKADSINSTDGSWQYTRAITDNDDLDQNPDILDQTVSTDYWRYVNPDTSNTETASNYLICGGILNTSSLSANNFYIYNSATPAVELSTSDYVADDNYIAQPGVITFIPGAKLGGISITAGSPPTILGSDSSSPTVEAQIRGGTIDLSRYISLNNDDNIVNEIYSSDNLTYTSTVEKGQDLKGHFIGCIIKLFTDTELDYNNSSKKKLTISNTSNMFDNLTFTDCKAFIPDDMSDTYKAVKTHGDHGESSITVPNTEKSDIYMKQRPIDDYIYKLENFAEEFNNYNQVKNLFNSNISKKIYNGILDSGHNAVETIYEVKNDNSIGERTNPTPTDGLILQNRGGNSSSTFSELFNKYKDYNGYIEVKSSNTGVIYSLTEAEKSGALNLTLDLLNSNATSGYHSLNVYLQLMENKNVNISNQYVNKTNDETLIYAAPLRLYLKNPWYYSYGSGPTTNSYGGRLSRTLSVFSIANIKASIPGSNTEDKIETLSKEYLPQMIEQYIVPRIEGYGTSITTNIAKVNAIMENLYNVTDPTAILNKLTVLGIDTSEVTGTDDAKVLAIADAHLSDIELKYITIKNDNDTVLNYLANLKFIDVLKDTVAGGNTNAKIATLENEYLSKLESNYVASQILGYSELDTDTKKIKAIVQQLDNTATTDEKKLNYLVLAINNIDMTNNSTKISGIANLYLPMMESKLNTSNIEGYSNMSDSAEKVNAIVRELDNTATDEQKILNYLVNVLVDTIEGDDIEEKISNIANEYLSYMENYFTNSKIEGYNDLSTAGDKTETIVKAIKSDNTMTDDAILEYLLNLKSEDKGSLNTQIYQDYDGPAFYQYKNTFEDGASNTELINDLTSSEKLDYCVNCGCSNFVANGGNANTQLVANTFSIGDGDCSSNPMTVQNITNNDKTNLLCQKLIINKGCTYYANGTIEVRKLKKSDFPS